MYKYCTAINCTSTVSDRNTYANRESSLFKECRMYVRPISNDLEASARREACLGTNRTVRRAYFICFIGRSVVLSRTYKRDKEEKKNGMRGCNSDIIIVTTYQYYSMQRISK